MYACATHLAGNHSASQFRGLAGHVAAPQPYFKCTRCGHHRSVHPAAIGFFPATPDAARVLYSDELMRFTFVYMAGGQRIVESLGKALASFHVANGCVRGNNDAIWRNLGPAAQQWQLVDTAARAKRRWAHCAFLSTLSNQLVYLAARSGRLLVSFLLSCCTAAGHAGGASDSPFGYLPQSTSDAK